MLNYEIKRRIIAAIYPNRCPFCGEVVGCGEYCCNGCRKILPYYDDDFEVIENISHFSAVCRYTGIARDAVLSLKYGRQVCAAEVFALMLSRKISGGDYLVPVPSSFESIWNRGFAGAELIARKLSQRVNIPVMHALCASDSKAEQKFFSRKGRYENAQRSFMLSKRQNVFGKNLVLIDDVCTTGATLSAAAKILLDAGAARVDAAVFAKTEDTSYSEDTSDTAENIEGDRLDG